MGIGWPGESQLFLQVDLPGSGKQQVCSAHYLGDSLIGIIDNYCQLIGSITVCPVDDEITDIPLQHLAVPVLDAVFKTDFFPVGANAHGFSGGLVRGGFPASAWINRALHSHACMYGNFAAGAGTGVGKPLLLQLIEYFPVAGFALALEQNRLIPFEAKCFQSAQYFICTAFDGAAFIDILHAHQPAALVVQGICIAGNGGNQGAKMQRASG